MQQDDVVFHPHGLTHSQVVEERRALDADRQIHDDNVSIVEEVEDGRLAKVQLFEQHLLQLRFCTDQQNRV